MLQLLRPILTTDLHWQAPAEPLLSELPITLKPHLLDTGSLTARVRELSGGEASVSLLRHDYAKPTGEEAQRLSIAASDDVLLRDIHLFGGPVTSLPWIFAHTVIPKGTLSGEGERLGQLGNKPLGEALFADPEIRRGSLELTKLLLGNDLFATAITGLAEAPKFLWGRRSQFYLSNGGSLLVAEFFLPAHPAVRGVLAE